eukprot:UN03677
MTFSSGNDFHIYRNKEICLFNPFENFIAEKNVISKSNFFAYIAKSQYSIITSFTKAKT